MKVVTSLFIFLFSIPVFSQLDINLDLKSGETYPLRLRNVINIEQEYNDEPFFTFIIADSKVNFLIESGSYKKGYKAKVSYEWAIVRMISDNRSVFLNSSENKKNVEFSRIVNNIEGKTFDVELSKNGEISQIKGLSEIIDDAFALNIGVTNREILESIVKRLLGEQSIIDYFSELSGVYSHSNLKIGDSWDHKFSIFSGFESNVNTKMTFSDFSDGEIKVIEKGIISSNAENQQMLLISESTIKTQLSGNQNGKIILDYDSGWPIKAYSNYTLKGRIVEEQNRRDWKIEIDSKNTVKEETQHGFTSEEKDQ